MPSPYTNYSGSLLYDSAAYTTTITATGTETITATSAPTRLVSSGQGNILVGGVADDTLAVNSLKDVYSGGGGIDTVVATVNTTLASDVENLSMNSDRLGVANDSANLVRALTVNATLDGRGGDDVLFSYGQKTTFLFEQGSGQDIIYNFHTGAASSDIVRLTGYGLENFAEVTGAMTQTGSDVLLTLSPTDLILFKNTTISAFTAENFETSIDPTKLKLTFADEFDGLSLQNKSAGGGIWGTSFPWSGYTTEAAHNISNDISTEQEAYVDPQFAGTGTTALGLNPFSIDSGVLTITAAPTTAETKPLLWNLDYTSGLLTTKGSYFQQYGYFEMRADLPDAKGAFPAFWLLPADGTFTSEIDIMEYIGETNTVHNTVHRGTDPAIGFTNYVADLTAGFHTYGLLWTADTLTWYVDGAQVAQTATPAGAQKPMYMLVNYAVGGEWAGDITPGTTLPTMAVDYVRAYSLAAAPLASPTQGTAGNDTLTGTGGPDTMVGHAGNDVYTVGIADTIVEAVGEGVDTANASVSYTLDANVEKLTLTGSAAINGTGNALDNVITGNSGANVLSGGGGADTLIGGAGNDTFVLTSGSEIVTEASGGGVDTVQVGWSYTLGANLENLTLTGSANVDGAGNSLNNYMIGNIGDNILSGGTGNDTLNGGLGNDTLAGGLGNDLYVIGDGDVVTEAAGEGVDQVNASVTHTLASNVENLTLTGTAAISGTGNDLANVINGNGAANTLTGGDGADTLTGGAGTDRLLGGQGDDVYFLGSDTDVVVEVAGEGIDTVNTNLNYTLATTVENLNITGTFAAYGYGSSLDNIINGNGYANTLEGRAGADTLSGGGGVDILVGGAGNDSLTGGTGNDTFKFNQGDGHDVITDFGTGADILDLSTLINGGFSPTLVTSGADTLVQFATGDDILLVGVSSAHLSSTATGFVYI